MGVGEFLGANSPAIIAVIGTVLGGLVGALSNRWQKEADWTNSLKLRHVERLFDFEERYLIRPIVEYLETELQILQKIYAQGLNKEDVDLSDLSKEHHLKMLLTEARVKVYGDKQLIEKFTKFTQKRIAIGNSMLDPARKDINQGYLDLKEAESITADIFIALKQRLSELES